MELTTLFTGRNRLRFEELASTNDYLAAAQRNGKLPEGSVVTTLYQHGGKGQAGNRWHSQTGANLLCSFLFYPSSLSADRVFHLQLFASLAVCETVTILSGAEATVKWPNDVYLHDRKVAGILPENVVLSNAVRQSIIGIGLNVNQVDFPSDIPIPVSIAQVKGQMSPLDDVLHILCNQLEKRYLQLQRGDHAGLLDVYLNRLYRKGEWARYESAGEEFEGRIKGIDAIGRLVIEYKNGTEKPFAFREVAYR
ncbi:MAG: biotin--[acetyl-CoA-carboxylase] ligase [Bacteroidota bacterium]